MERLEREQVLSASHFEVQRMLANLYHEASRHFDRPTLYAEICNDISEIRQKFSFGDSVEFITSKGVRMKAKGVKNV